ncbi:hypothetical protein [Leptospira levettii]|uniref:Uncharacterized protein n=1 Tax=Leptospira levettii TaxID=2023178 RepID=A0ABY2MU11_9LEPT|nr:hypothetical protein [Leptospira levettii]TGL75384.1 hypothetical protein EHQ60_00225 [Leptospira levettii]
MAEVLIDIDSIASKLAQKLGPEMVAEISKRQKGVVGGSSDSGSGSKKESAGATKEKKKESLTDKTVNSYKEGAASSTLDQDASELRSGRFSGVIGRRIDSAKKIKDKIQEERKKRAEKYNIGEKGQDPSILSLGQPNKDNVVQKYNILEVKEAKFTKVIMQGSSSGSFGGGITIPGRGGSGISSPPSSADQQDGNMERRNDGVAKAGQGIASGIGIPVIGAILGATVAAVSTMGGMHQQALQAQEGTFSAYRGLGGRLGSGITSENGIVRTPELAQLGIARARILGGDPNSQIGMNSRYGTGLGVRFGVTQGLGGSAGAEMFAKLKKYGGFDESESSLKKILSDGIRSGFGGLRQAEFMQQVSGISENAYNSGMGTQSVDRIAGAFSGLNGAGIRDNRLSSVYSAINDNMTKDGGQMNSMLVAHHMQQNGGDYLAAMAAAEEGMGSQANIGAVNQMTQGMDPKTKAIWMKKQGLITATEGQNSVSIGKDILTEAGKSTTVSIEGRDAGNDVRNVSGQTQIAHSNQLDAAAMGAAFEAAYAVQNKIFDLMIKLAESGNKTVAKLKKYLD